MIEPLTIIFGVLTVIALMIAFLALSEAARARADAQEALRQVRRLGREFNAKPDKPNDPYTTPGPFVFRGRYGHE